MIAAIIIVFREILEICLLTSVFSAILNNLSHKNKLILAGIVMGSLIAGLIAISLKHITHVFNGEGQEILNIVILSISIFCIAWTLLFVNKHTKMLKEKLVDIKNQEQNYFAIVLVIALSIAREGAEMILLLQGVSTKLNSFELIYGSFIGLLIGIFAGAGLYLGLLKIPAKHFFKIINVFLILLAAGMAAQIAHYLIVMDLIQVLTNTLWNSSWLISESSNIGKLLHNLIGYCDHPTVLELVFYVVTIGIISVLKYKN